MSFLTHGNFSNLVSAIELKSALDDVAQRHGQLNQPNTNINGLKTDFLSRYNRKLTIITNSKNVFGDQLIPRNSAFTSPGNILPGTLLTYTTNEQKIHGVVSTKQGKNPLFLTVDPLNEGQYKKWLESNPVAREVILTPQDITSSKQIPNLKPNLFSILFMILFNWWIPDLNTEGSTFLIILRFILGMSIYFVIIYSSLYILNQYL